MFRIVVNEQTNRLNSALNLFDAININVTLNNEHNNAMVGLVWCFLYLKFKT